MTIYYSIVSLSFIYLIYQFRKDLVSELIVLCFYAGLAAFFGKTIENTFKILLVILSFYSVIRIKAFQHIGRKEEFILLSFLFFSASFLISAFLNQTNFSLTFSQYGKYFTPFCLFFVFRYYALFSPYKMEKLTYLIFTLLNVQIILSIAKYIILGTPEWVVGSIAFEGGGVATPLPMLGFMILWIHRKGNFSNKDWLYTIALLFIGFVSIKRAVWFIMPAVIFFFMFYIPKRKIPKKLLLGLSLIPLVFYFGIRLNPVLNKEQKIWGSFDLDYVINHTSEYSFGKKKNDNLIDKQSAGRGGATLFLFEKFTNSQVFAWNDIFGYGLEQIVTTDYETFNNEKFGVNHRGSVTGVLKSYIISGYIGILTTLLYMISILIGIKEKRIRYVLIGFVAWEYFFYSGLIFQNQALNILLFYFIIYSNFLTTQSASQRVSAENLESNVY